MCEICGGPHFTVKCPNSLRDSTQNYDNLNTQQSTKHYLQDFYDRLNEESKTYKNFVTIDDSDFEEINLHSVLWYMKYGPNPDYINSINDLNDQNNVLHVSCENEVFQDKEEEPETIMVKSDPPPVSHEDQEKKKKLIIDFSKSQEEIDTQLAEYKKWQKEQEENIPETETKMDAEVPPPEQEVKDDFWSDSEDEEEEAKAWAAYQKECLKRKEIIEAEEIEMEEVGWLFNDNKEEEEVEEIELRECLELIFGIEEEVEMNWEDEFIGELEGIPKFIDGEPDHERDLAEIEALLEGRRIEKIEPIVVKLNCRDPPIEIMKDEGHHCQPMAKMNDGSPLQAKLQGKEKRRRLSGNQMKKKKRMKFRVNYSPYGKSHNFFNPGKFYRYNSNTSEFLNMFLNSAGKFLIINNHRVELSGLDKVQIKEKPPDKI